MVGRLVLDIKCCWCGKASAQLGGDLTCLLEEDNNWRKLEKLRGTLIQTTCDLDLCLGFCCVNKAQVEAGIRRWPNGWSIVRIWTGGNGQKWRWLVIMKIRGSHYPSTSSFFVFVLFCYLQVMSSSVRSSWFGQCLMLINLVFCSVFGCCVPWRVFRSGIREELQIWRS